MPIVDQYLSHIDEAEMLHSAPGCGDAHSKIGGVLPVVVPRGGAFCPVIVIFDVVESATLPSH